jgi:2-polyprenyl-3-methyl-5-hydroxy-6-metoxy-1,4-benzoquinol methylase
LEKEMITQHLSIDQMKDSMRAPWIAGDFGALAREIGAPEAEGFVARMGLEPGARVLDIACGMGNVTIPLACRGAMVTGLDMMPHLLEEARARAAREGLHIRFDEGFAETLPYPDGSFDVLLSMFGIMSVSLEKRTEGTYAEYRAQKAGALAGKGFRLPLC